MTREEYKDLDIKFQGLRSNIDRAIKLHNKYLEEFAIEAKEDVRCYKKWYNGNITKLDKNGITLFLIGYGCDEGSWDEWNSHETFIPMQCLLDEIWEDEVRKIAWRQVYREKYVRYLELKKEFEEFEELSKKFEKMSSEGK